MLCPIGGRCQDDPGTNPPHRSATHAKQTEFRLLLRLCGAAVGSSDDLKHVAVRILEVDAASAIIAVDLAAALLNGVSPILDPALADAAEDLVEIVLADQEGVVLWSDLAFGLKKVERYAVVEFHYEER